MRILIASFSFYPSIDGVANVVYQHAKHFLKQGHDVTVVTQGAANRKDKSHENVNIIEFDVRGGPLVSNFYRGECRKYITFLNDAHTNYDVVFFHAWQIWSTDLFLFSKSKTDITAKTIFVSHCAPSMKWTSVLDIGRTILLKPYLWFAMPRLMKKFDRLVFLSSKKTGDRHQDYKKASISYPNKVEVIPNGLPDIPSIVGQSSIVKEIEKKTKNKKIILYVANYVRGKNQLRAIEVFRELQYRSDAHLVLIGSSCNRYCRKLISHVRFKQLEDKVSILFEVGRKDVLSLYSLSYLTLFTSKTECCPLSVLESLAYKKPVVSTDVGCLSEFPGVRVSHSNSELVRNTDLLLCNDQYYLDTQRAIDNSQDLMSWSSVMKSYDRLLEVVYED